MRGTVIPVEITIYEDRTFTFVTKTPPAAELIKKAAGVAKGSGVPQTDKVGEITRDQVREIATTKLPDLNANDVDAAMKIVEGTARSMGVTVSIDVDRLGASRRHHDRSARRGGAKACHPSSLHDRASSATVGIRARRRCKDTSQSVGGPTRPDHNWP